MGCRCSYFCLCLLFLSDLVSTERCPTDVAFLKCILVLVSNLYGISGCYEISWHVTAWWQEPLRRWRCPGVSEKLFDYLPWLLNVIMVRGNLCSLCLIELHFIFQRSNFNRWVTCKNINASWCTFTGTSSPFSGRSFDRSSEAATTTEEATNECFGLLEPGAV